MAKIFSDGYTLPKGGGYVVLNEERRLLAKGCTDRKVTNNEVELRGVANAARVAKQGDTLSTDSKTVISWLKKGYSSVRPDMYEVIKATVEMIERKAVHLIWEPRERNLAGRANEAMHKARKKEERRLVRMRNEKPVLHVKQLSPYRFARVSIKEEPIPQHEALQNALRKMREGVSVLLLSIQERVALEVSQF